MVGSPSEILKRGYSDSEIKDLYAFGHYFYSVGRLNDARVVFEALSQIVPTYVPAWLGLVGVSLQLENYEQALQAARAAFRQAPDLPLVLILLITTLLSTGDYTTAGTYLGEFGEKIQAAQISDRRLIRFYQAQLFRYRTGIKH